MRLSPFYPILDLDLAEARGLEVTALAVGLADLEVSLLQLRAKRMAAGAFLRSAIAVVEAMRPRAQPPVVVINDRVDIAMLAGALGVHLGQTDLPAESARRLLPAGATIGLSTHTVQQVQRVLNDASGVATRASQLVPRNSYLAFGPVFATGSKDDAEPVTGLDGLRRVREIYGGPLVAIGGIRLDNCREAWAAGADAVAVISGWLEARDPIAAAREFLAAAPARPSADGRAGPTRPGSP